MIDTVRFKTYCSTELWAEMEVYKSTIKRERKDNKTGKVTHFLNSQVVFPPYNTPITVMAYDYKDIYIECSLPKVIFGHNVEMLYPSKLPEILTEIHTLLETEYGKFPSIETWELQRLDICYNYKFLTQNYVEKVLLYIKTLELIRKNKHIYKKETVSFSGRVSSLDFYLKYPEFKKKDYKRLVEQGFTDFAEEVLTLSEGILRAELKLKRMQLKQLFKDKSSITYKDILDVNFYYKTLNDCFALLFKNPNTKLMADKEALERLTNCYAKPTAINLFLFNKYYNAKDEYTKDLLRNYLTTGTIKKKLTAIASAGVGLPIHNNKVIFDLTVPNKLAVTPEPPAPSALAPEPVEEEKYKVVNLKSERPQLKIDGILPF